jgi:hypothetical protein
MLLHNVAALTLREKFYKSVEQRLWAWKAKQTRSEFKEGDLVIELPNRKGALQTPKDTYEWPYDGQPRAKDSMFALRVQFAMRRGPLVFVCKIPL